jgi:hypothetical protein
MLRIVMSADSQGVSRPMAGYRRIACGWGLKELECGECIMIPDDGILRAVILRAVIRNLHAGERFYGHHIRNDLPRWPPLRTPCSMITLTFHGTVLASIP